MEIEAEVAARPAVRVNQLGYLPFGPKTATLVGRAPEPVEFTVVAEHGETAYAGRSRPWPVRPEPTSGLEVHTLDFSDLTAAGGFRIVAGRAGSHAFRIKDQLYARLAGDALRFFYLQRSGCSIDDARAPGYGRPAATSASRPTPGTPPFPRGEGQRPSGSTPAGPSRTGSTSPAAGNDAGDHGKYVTSGALPAWQLLATLDLVRAHPAAAPSGFEAALVEEVRWQLDWLLRMQVPPGHAYAGLAFHRVHGTEWAPPAMWPHQDPATRVLHRPSTGAGLHLAAVAARAVRTFVAIDPAYARRLLTAAEAGYATATDHPNLIAPDDHGAHGGGSYGDDDLSDDFFWAAAELWLTTGDPVYRVAVEASPHHSGETFPIDGFDYDRVAGPAHLSLGSTALVADAARRVRALQRDQAWGQPYAPNGPWTWGSNGRIGNNLMVLGSAYLMTGEDDLLAATRTGMDYLLGRNALGQSYVTGYGADFSRHQRTRHFATDLDPASPAAGGRPGRRADQPGLSRLPRRPAAAEPAAAAGLPGRA